MTEDPAKERLAEKHCAMSIATSWPRLSPLSAVTASFLPTASSIPLGGNDEAEKCTRFRALFETPS